MEYVKSLIPGFKRAMVEDDIERLINEVKEITLPVVRNISETYSLISFKDTEIIKLDKEFSKLRFKSAKLGLLKGLVFQLENTLIALQNLDDVVDKYFGANVTTSGITYSSASFLRYLDLISFNLKYTRKLMLYMLNKEQVKAGQVLTDPLTKAEYNWLVSNRTSYFNSVAILSTDARKLDTVIAGIPNIPVTEDNAENINSTVGLDTVDPLKMNFLPPRLNPVYIVGLAVAEWTASRHSAAKEEKRALEYRLLAIKDLQTGKKDAKLEQEIAYTEKRIKQLNFKLAKLEE